MPQTLNWLLVESGLSSIHETGRNAYLIILARTCRMFAYGTNSLILAIFFSALKFSDQRIGLFMTLTLLGDVFLGTFLTLIADRVGRRKVLLGGSVLMIFSGLTFSYFENFWILLIAAIFGVVSVTGGDFGPFRSVEESILAKLTTPSTRADVLAWYVTTSTMGSAIGTEASGRIVQFLQSRDGWNEIDAYHALFWIYTAMGIVNVILVLPLSSACELHETYTQLPQDESEQMPSKPPTANKSWLANNLASISAPTRSVMYKLWSLLVVDSLADGMVPYSLTNYYMDIKFHPSKSTLGDITSASYFLGAIGASFAGPLARHIGLINTMVFTHVPSSASVVLFPFPNYLWMTAALLLVRAGLNNMDQAPRSAFIAAVVKPEETTAVMGITSMVRTLASMGGPTLTGLFAANDQFWIAYVIAGSCRLAYDFGLYALFVNMKVNQSDAKDDEATLVGRDEEESLEMSSLVGSDSDEDGFEKKTSQEGEGRVDGSLRIPEGHERLRTRSPHRREESHG